MADMGTAGPRRQTRSMKSTTVSIIEQPILKPWCSRATTSS
jgi:hypothetical protein